MDTPSTPQTTADERSSHAYPDTGRRTRRGPGRPPASDSTRTKQSLLDAARECFGAFGYDKTSNSDIAELAGLSTGPLYHHFGSKRELFGAVANDSLQQLHERIDEALAEVSDTPIADQLGVLLQTVAQIHGEDAALARFNAIGLLETRRTPELNRYIDRNQLMRLRRNCEQMMIRAHLRDEINPDVPYEGIAELIAILYYGVIYYCVISGRAAQPSEAVDLLIAGLKGELFKSPRASNADTD